METLLASRVLPVVPVSRKLLWIGRVLTGLAVAFLVFDAAAKLAAVPPVIEAMVRLGFPAEIVRPLGALLLAITVLHVIPRTQALGALLLTAYLGGATAALVRVGDIFWFPVFMGIIVWAAYALRSARR